MRTLCCVTSCCFLYGISFFQNVKKLRLCHEKSGKTNTVLSAKKDLCCSNITYSTAGRNFGRILGENGRYAHCSIVSFACCRKTPVVIVYTFYSKSSCSNMNQLKCFLNLVQVALMRSISAFPKGVFLHRCTERILLWAPLFRAGERGANQLRFTTVASSFCNLLPWHDNRGSLVISLTSLFC